MANAIVTLNEAREQGLARYFTGKPCKRGHIAERFVTGRSCSECATISNRERVEYRRQYRLKHKEKIAKQKAEDYREKAEHYAAYHANYYRKNIEKVKAKNRRLYEENAEERREATKSYRMANPAMHRVWVQKRKEHIRRATPCWVDKSKIVTKYKERIAMNNVTGMEHHVDHIVPLRGKNVCGLNVHWNLRVILARDNLKKHNKFEQ